MAKVQNRRNQWTCNLCGKSFFEEKHLDMHFDARHNNVINFAEDAICFANYCDIMRCKVLLAKDATLSFGDPTTSTDIEVWNEANAYRTAISTSGPKELAKLQNRNFIHSHIRTRSDKLDENSNDEQCIDNKSNSKNSHCFKENDIDIEIVMDGRIFCKLQFCIEIRNERVFCH